MRKAFFILMCLSAMMVASLSAKAQDVTVTIKPGYTWFSYPKAEVMDIASALGDFVPMNGDVIKSQYGSTIYQNGIWRGFQNFTPGWGYKYYSTRTENVDLVFRQASSSYVTTDEPVDVTATSAVVGGTVDVPEGTHVFLCGVCWGTEPSPDIDGEHTTEETGIGSFSSTLEGLNPNTTYYVRAYAVSDHGLAYGNEQSFTTEAGGGSGGDHAYVDLGLPSGLLWATCNIGANSPEGYGDYFAWGETQPKDNYDWSNYQYGDWENLTKYCNNSIYGYNGYTDYLTTLLPVDDAATDNWGSDWRMPTEEEWLELYNNTTVTWTTQNGVYGRLFTASNGNSLFLPAAGYRSGSSLSGAGSNGYYWSSSLYMDFPLGASYFNIQMSGYYMIDGDRSYGQPVRAVRSPQTEHAYVDLDLPSGLLWATCNVGADSPEDYGYYFAWGETQPKATYEWSTYQYCNGIENTLTKYCNNSSYGYNGFTDDLTTLLPEDDAATANWGSGWRMPTQAEFQELLDYTTVTWTTQNGVNGRLFTASNGNSLFLPAAGCRESSGLSNVGSNDGYYWSSSLSTNYPCGAWYFNFYSENYGVYYDYFRYCGQSVRPVRVGSQN